MDERFQSKRTWVAVVAVGSILFLCVALCFLAALGTMFLHNSTAVVPQVQVPAGGEGAAVPQVYYGHWGGRTGIGLLGFLGLGAVLFFGLLVLLGIGRFVHRPWRCSPNAVGGEWKDHRHAWYPRHWHGHVRGSYGSGGPAGSQEMADEGNQAQEEAE
jgi:hypothetical protein